MHKLCFVLLIGILAACSVAGVSDDGSQFVGKWSCKAVGTISIRHNGGNNYIIDDFMPGGVAVVHKDGVLTGPNGAAFSIDKRSGKLLGMNLCEMERVK